MTDLTSMVDVTVTSVIQRVVGASFGGLATLVRPRPKPADGGTDAERVAAAATFTRAVIDYRTTLTVLAGVRATLGGAFVTLPLLVRQINRVPQLTTEVADAYAAFYMVGSAPVLEEADSVVLALDRANDTFHAASQRERARQVNQALAEVDEAIGRLVAAVRADRRFKPLDPAIPDAP